MNNMWPTLIAVAAAVVALVWLHIWWQGRFARAIAEWHNEVEFSRRHEADAAKKLQAEQEALFNSMIEGVLVLDEQGRIRLANRAFKQLFSGPAG